MEDTFSTNKGTMTAPQIISVLMYGSYAANRDGGMTHEALVRLGIGTEAMRVKYELELKGIFEN